MVRMSTYREPAPIYGHGMWATPSVDGWQWGIRELNGYRAEVVIHGDGLARAWNDYSLYILDYLTGETVVMDGKAKYPDIRARGIEAMRNGRRNGVHGTKVPSTFWN